MQHRYQRNKNLLMVSLFIYRINLFNTIEHNKIDTVSNQIKEKESLKHDVGIASMKSSIISFGCY
ncbi:MAG: hypothetical protein ACI90V_011105 [Bacillariaceae sp.]|jgi:hypothetical protein